MKRVKLLFTAGFILFAFACNNKTKEDVLFSNLDTTTNPADDFFQYANGGWIKNNPIPNEENAWGIGNLVNNENLNRLKTINENAAKEKAAKGTAQQKIGDFWKAAMDSAAIEEKGITPLSGYLKKISEANDLSAVFKVMAELDKIGVDGLMGTYVSQDDKNSEAYALYFVQNGIFLPEREYYLKTDTTSLTILNGYKQYISNVLVMSGSDKANADKASDEIVKMETSVAKIHRKLAELRDPYKNYNKFSTADFYKLSPSVNFEQYFQINGIPKVDSVIVGQPEYYKELGNFLKNTSVDTWKQFLTFRLLNDYSEALPDKFSVAKFNFYKLLTGAQERKPRWKRVLAQEQAVMGELLGQLFVKEYFNEQTKKRYEDLVEAIRDAYKERIEKLTWMSDSTKKKALVKLAAIKKKVGYPNKWKDFTALEIVPDNYAQNIMNGRIFWWNYRLNKLGKPVDRDEWSMTPQTYNAYYNPSNNEIVLPAGIFTVPGYRDEELDDAVVYGYAGASTIGHEITHGFDDEGRQYDEKGNLQNWWTKNDEEQFTQRSKKMIEQFNNYVVIDTFRINGEATLGENIADLGGILLGWDAYQKTAEFKSGKETGGLTPSKRFFLGYALGWLGHTRKESLRNQVLTDVHSPAKFRVNGPFADVDAFYTIFNVQPTNKMYMPDSSRVRIW